MQSIVFFFCLFEGGDIAKQDDHNSCRLVNVVQSLCGYCLPPTETLTEDNAKYKAESDIVLFWRSTELPFRGLMPILLPMLLCTVMTSSAGPFLVIVTVAERGEKRLVKSRKCFYFKIFMTILSFP